MRSRMIFVLLFFFFLPAHGNAEQEEELIQMIGDSPVVIDISELDGFKESIVDAIRNEIEFIREEEQTKSFFSKEKKESSGAGNALNDLVSLKVLKMLDDMSKDERNGIFNSIVRGTWNHKYEIAASTFFLLIVTMIVANNSNFLDTISFEVSRGVTNGIASVVGGSIKGSVNASGNILKSLGSSITQVFAEVD